MLVLMPTTRVFRPASKYGTFMISRNFSFLKLIRSEKSSLVFTNQFANLQQQYSPTKYPIVLCHGLSGFDSLVFLPKPKLLRQNRVKRVIKDGLIKVDYWYGIQDMLSKIGCEVFIGKVPPFGSISERAMSLNAFLDSQFQEVRQSNDNPYKDPVKVNIIAHSMGGLDSRYLISNLKSENYKVASLTTISTPHHGSEAADFVMDNINHKLILTKAIPELTTDYLKEFNNKVPNIEDVAYFSYGARFVPKWFNVFRTPWKIIKHRIELENRTSNKQKSIDNDGMVSVESAKWGQYLGTLDQVDHLDLINWTNRLRTFIDMSIFHHKPTFNALAFYSHVVNSLSNKGF